MLRRKYSVFRDTIHGDVYLTEEEVRLLDTPQMQRLRGVRQLGTACLVFPGANHTRFEHSIGTLAMTHRMIEAINRNSSLHPSSAIGVSEEEARIIRMAALIHDVTHIPYGHNIEDQTGLFRRHDTKARYKERFEGKPLGDLLKKFGVYREVLSTLTPKAADPKEEDSENEPASAVPPYWSAIIDGTIGADIFDYLRRDAYYTGLNLYYDSRILNYFKIDRASNRLYVDTAKNNMLREDIASEIVRVLEARYYFSERVYYHHAKISAGALLAKAAEHAIASGVARESDFHDKTDESLIDFLYRLIYPNASMRDRVRGLLDRLRNRDLPKRACVYPVYCNRDKQQELVDLYFAKESYEARWAKEKRISELASQSTGHDVMVLLYCPARKMQLKEAGVLVRVPGRDELVPLHDLRGTVSRTADLSDAYRDLWKFYVLACPSDPETLRAVAKICETEIPAENAYFLPNR